MKWLRKRRLIIMRTRAQRLDAAQREVDVSRSRLHESRESVVRPLNAAAAKNGFAEIIAESLSKGYNREAR